LTLLGSSTISPHGQITIPKKAREKFDLNPGDTVAFYVEDERLILKKG
jgi:AbrB family looped-hinge helix DNA binding protein